MRSGRRSCRICPIEFRQNINKFEAQFLPPILHPYCDYFQPNQLALSYNTTDEPCINARISPTRCCTFVFYLIMLGQCCKLSKLIVFVFSIIISKLLLMSK